MYKAPVNPSSTKVKSYPLKEENNGKLKINLETIVAKITETIGLKIHLPIGVLTLVTSRSFKILNVVLISSVINITATYPLIPNMRRRTTIKTTLRSESTMLTLIV